MDDKISSINDDETQNNLNEKTMKYKNLDDWEKIVWESFINLWIFSNVKTYIYFYI